MAFSKATKAALGTTMLALATAAFVGQGESSEAAITVYKSPT